jgi:hypothetical protein
VKRKHRQIHKIKLIEERRKYKVVMPTTIEKSIKMLVYTLEVQHFNESSEITVIINAKPIDTAKEMGTILILLRALILG